MQDLLFYYECELVYLWCYGCEFVDCYFKIVGCFQFNVDGSQDLYVECFIEVFVLFSVCVFKCIEDDYFEFIDVLLDVLYLYYLWLFLLCLIVYFDMDGVFVKFSVLIIVLCGMVLQSCLVCGVLCCFCIVYDVVLVLVVVQFVVYCGVVEVLMVISLLVGSGVQILLNVWLVFDQVSFDMLGIDVLCLFLDGELLLCVVLCDVLVFGVKVVYVEVDGGGCWCWLESVLLCQVGFVDNEVLVDFLVCLYLVYCLFIELFVYLEKFGFVDLDFKLVMVGVSCSFILYLILYVSVFECGNQLVFEELSVSNVCLGCMLIVNLFIQVGELIWVIYCIVNYVVLLDV